MVYPGGVGEDRTHAHSVGRGSDRLTIAEAAALLGVHKNTVRNRIKNGTYRAEMVQTERGPTYLIERESLLTNLTANTLSSASQEVVSTQAMEFVQELLRPFVSELGEVREELGAERARRQMAEERVASLEVELEAFGETREWSEPVEEEPERAELPEQPSGWLAPVDKLPWWHYVLGLFLVFSGGFVSWTLLQTFALRIPAPPGFVVLPIALAIAWSSPGIFGFWVGYRKRNLRLWSQVLPLGALVGAVAFLGTNLADLVFLVRQNIPAQWGEVFLSIYNLYNLAIVVFPVWLLFVSASLVGNTWQRRRIGRISGTTPASPISRTTQGGGQQPRKDLTPAQQAMLGWGGTIISALITLGGTIILERGGP